MPLDQHIAQRILGIAAGLIAPETGMEKHFRRVCLGEATPLTAEEREWYEFVTRHRAQPKAIDGEGRHQREHEQKLQQSQQQQEEENCSLRKQIVSTSEEVERLRAQVALLQREILDLRAQVPRAEQSGSPGTVFAPPPATEESWNICPICHGDGGVRGGCYKCEGTGWAK